MQRHISNTAGTTSWWQVAADRELWFSKQQHFVERHDAPWSSGKQSALPSIPNLAPRTNPREGSHRGEALLMTVSLEGPMRQQS